MRGLKTNGLPYQSLQDVFRATVEAKLLRAALAWSGFCTAADRLRLNSFLRRCLKLGYRASDSPDLDSLFSLSGEQLFDRIKHKTLARLLNWMTEILLLEIYTKILLLIFTAFLWHLLQLRFNCIFSRPYLVLLSVCLSSSVRNVLRLNGAS